MKKVIYIIALLIGSTTMAQTITVNGTPMLVSDDISFPFWLESGSSIDIGENVISISVIEFSIVNDLDQNNLNFIQTKNISSLESVPDNYTWKIEGVLLDTLFINQSIHTDLNNTMSHYNLEALSQKSEYSMNFGDAMCYCDSLNEDGYDNWFLPSLEEIIFVSSGGGITPNERSIDYLWTSSMNSSSGNERVFVYNFLIRLSDGSIDLSNNITKFGGSSYNLGTVNGPFVSDNYVRCVRFATN